jgi:hypothetical protein
MSTVVRRPRGEPEPDGSQPFAPTVVDLTGELQGFLETGGALFVPTGVVVQVSQPDERAGGAARVAGQPVQLGGTPVMLESGLLVTIAGVDETQMVVGLGLALRVLDRSVQREGFEVLFDGGTGPPQDLGAIRINPLSPDPAVTEVIRRAFLNDLPAGSSDCWRQFLHPDVPLSSFINARSGLTRTLGAAPAYLHQVDRRSCVAAGDSRPDCRSRSSGTGSAVRGALLALRPLAVRDSASGAGNNARLDSTTAADLVSAGKGY